jgi:hypothetical protein
VTLRAAAWLTGIAVLLSPSAHAAGAARAPDCSTEAKILSHAQSELPSLDVASPADRPPYCITLETLMAFAGRVKAHVAHCPASEFAAALPEWTKTRVDYSKLFAQHRCKRTM